MITYLKKLTEERDSLTASATALAEKAAADERDLSDTERASMTAWQTRCAEIDSQLTEYSAQADSQRAYARLRESLTAHDEEPATNGNGSRPAAMETRSWGDLFVESGEFRSYQGTGPSQRVEVPWDTRANLALADFPTALKTPYLHTVAPYRESTPLLDAIPQITVSSNSVEWVRWAPNPVPAASVVAEGAPKPEMALTATAVSDTLETYAHYKGITRQALEDIPQVRSIIESRLRQGLARALDTAAVTALNAATYTGVSNASMLSGIRIGLATVQSQGYGTPASVVLNPADLAAIDLSVMGSTLMGPQLNNSVWGLNFIPTPGVAVNTAYVGDLGSAVQLFRRANASIFLTDSHGEFFISNIVLILAEIRASVAVSEPGALVEVTKTPLMAATVADVRVYLGQDPATVVDEEALAAAVTAANDLVATFRPDLTEGEPWAPRAQQAAVVEAARLYGRRGSVQGVAAFADIGVSLLPRLDPEVRSLLELGEYQTSVVA